MKRSWSDGGAHRERVRNQVIDADTVRRRELEDRKGVAIGVFGGYTVRHSTRRTDAYDVLGSTGLILCSGGRVKVGRFLGRMLP